MRRRAYLTVVAVLAGVAPWLDAQDQKAEIQKRLAVQFTLTQTTPDKSDIVKTGAIVALHKDGLLMYSATNPIPPQSTYKKGKIARNVNFWTDVGNGLATQQSASDIVQRSFAAGEKFWVTNVDVKDGGVVFRLFSDPYDDVRYFGELKFPFTKGVVPPADDVLRTIAEVLTVEPADNPSGGASQETGQGSPAPTDDSQPVVPAGNTSRHYVNSQNRTEYLDLGSDHKFFWRVGGREFTGSYDISEDIVTLRFPPVDATARGKLAGGQFNCCLSNGLDPTASALIDNEDKNWALVAPPPALADTPPAPPRTIALGQTKDQVMASFGQPQKIANLGTKDIYYYPDMKVTFVQGKVTDVQ